MLNLTTNECSAEMRQLGITDTGFSPLLASQLNYAITAEIQSKDVYKFYAQKLLSIAKGFADTEVVIDVPAFMAHTVEKYLVKSGLKVFYLDKITKLVGQDLEDGDSIISSVTELNLFKGLLNDNISS